MDYNETLPKDPMFNRKPKHRTFVYDTYAELAQKLVTYDETSEEYAKILDQIVKLHKLEEAETSNSRISPDTLALIGANLIGLVLIIHHEQTGIITSKAFGTLLKPR